MSSRVLGTCRTAGCGRCNTMGLFCVEHYQESIGKPVALYQRPALNRPSVIAGKTPTSRKAAERAVLKSGSQRERIYSAIQESPDGLTRDELEVLTRIPCNSLNPRLRELANDGWIVDSGLVRLTRASCEAVVWKAAC